MIIRICKDCGYEVGGCTHCNPTCPLCGGEIKKVDYVKYMLEKQRRENEKSNL